jgi:hypothetical protein
LAHRQVASGTRTINIDRFDSLALLRDHLDFLSPDDRDWLLFRTAERVFFWPLDT